jgi:transcription initiation factor TFIIB
VDKKDVARCYRLLLQELDFHMPISDPLTYVSKIAEKTEISGKTQGVAIAILREAKRKRVGAGKDPMGMAAAALYIACLQNNEKITQRDLADAAGVTEVTVRNRYKALKIQLKLETPDQKLQLNCTKAKSSLTKENETFLLSKWATMR